MYKRIEERKLKLEETSDAPLKEMLHTIQTLLNDNNIPNEIKVRTKNIYGIYKRLNEGHKLSDIHDLLALKIMIDEVAKLMNDSGLICITSFISSLEINRKMTKEIIWDKFFLVYINTPLEECERRDKKGLYAKARKGIIKDFTGINSVFEEPKDINLIVNNIDYRECAKKYMNRLRI